MRRTPYWNYRKDLDYIKIYTSPIKGYTPLYINIFIFVLCNLFNFNILIVVETELIKRRQRLFLNSNNCLLKLYSYRETRRHSFSIILHDIPTYYNIYVLIN